MVAPGAQPLVAAAVRLRGAELVALRVTAPGTDAAFLIVLPAASTPCLTIALAMFLAASVAVSFIALVASSVNCLVNAPHHCIGSTTPAAASLLACFAPPDLRAGLAGLASAAPSPESSSASSASALARCAAGLSAAGLAAVG